MADNEIDPAHTRINPSVYESEGVVYENGGLKIIAIKVDHGEFIRPAYAFTVEYGGHIFVHSHDTRYNENLIAQAQGADVLSSAEITEYEARALDELGEECAHWLANGRYD